MDTLGLTFHEFVFGMDPGKRVAARADHTELQFDKGSPYYQPCPLKLWISDRGVEILRNIIIAHGRHAQPDRTLFPFQDSVLTAMYAEPNNSPHFKHILCKEQTGKFSFKPTVSGWTVGKNAVDHGFEYRAFFRSGGSERKTFGAVRFGDGARADCSGFDDYVHGGAIQTLLDEVTAECAMVNVCVLPTTVEAKFKMLRKVTPP